MKLRSLAISNMKHNIKRYVMYFFAMCFSVFTTYSFLSLLQSYSVYNKVQQNKNYSLLFVVFSVIILIFVLFFLISSNNSFIRARKKEISTYALFGMENSRIGKLLFLETLMIGMTAIIIGISFGVFFSKLTTMILLKMTMSAYSGNISFSLEPNAILITVAVFFGIFCLMGLSGLRVIKKFKLVDLFKGAKISEGKSKGSYIMLIISLILLIGGYYWAIILESSQVAQMMLTILAIVVAGTYMFFWGGFQKILHLTKINTKLYYKGSRLVSTSLLSHRAKTMATTMATIAILVAIGTTAISFGYTLFQNAEKQAYSEVSFDLFYYSDDTALLDDVHAIFDKYDSNVTDEIIIDRYISQPYAVNMPEYYSHYMNNNNNYLRTYSQSQYNKIDDIAKSTNGHIEVSKGNAIIIDAFCPEDDTWENLKLKYSDRQLNVDIIRGTEYSFGRILTVVLHDEDYAELVENGDIATKLDGKISTPATGINYTKALRSAEINGELTKLLQNQGFKSAYIVYNDYMSIFGLICFIGFFMCVIFILMTASMLYFKQTTIATEEKSQYSMLRKIGIDSDIENKIISKRLIPIFLVPLLVGIMHSMFAMKAADTMIFSNIIPMENSFISVIKTSAVMYFAYAAIYIIFYLITKAQYKRIIQ